MIALWSAAVFLLGSHFGTASSRLRDGLVHCLGEHGYLGSYSLVTLVAFAGLVAGAAVAGHRSGLRCRPVADRGML
jgi:hypothetical protein